LALDDGKVSGRHALIQQNSAGQWILTDLDSRNGIIVGGRRVRRLVLAAGVEFIIGKTQLLIEDFDPAQQAAPTPVPNLAEPAPPPPPEVLWPEFFSKFISATLDKIKDRPRALIPMNRVLRLRFLRGIQIDWEYHVGYGPRVLGRGSCDLPLYDPAATEKCFAIVPGQDGPRIELAGDTQVLLNSKPFSSEILKDGDMIAFGESLIEVRMLEAE